MTTAERKSLIERYAPRVRKIALELNRRMFAYVAEVEELESAGYVGLCSAARRWDPERGVPFETFVFPRVRGAMIDHMRRQRTASNKRNGTGQASLIPLDFPIGDGITIEDTLEASEESAVSELLATLSCLDERRRAMVFRHALLGDRMVEIAADYGLTESRVSQILSSAYSKLRPRVACRPVGPV